MNETDNKNKDNFLSTMHVKDNKLQNYKGQFYNNKDEADSHNHEYGGHFKIKDLFKRLECVQKEQKRNIEIEEGNNILTYYCIILINYI